MPDPALPEYRPCWVLHDRAWRPGWLREWKPASAVLGPGRDGWAGYVSYFADDAQLSQHLEWVPAERIADRSKPAPDVPEEDAPETMPPWLDAAPPWLDEGW